MQLGAQAAPPRSWGREAQRAGHVSTHGGTVPTEDCVESVAAKVISPRHSGRGRHGQGTLGSDTA